tara:strand:+ start:32922 stop:33161 length:240 start_codon:yes stop_codon:yes gene_type:complete
MTDAQKAALSVYFDAGRDCGKQMLACLSIKWHVKVSAALERRGLLERYPPPHNGMFKITQLGRFYAIENKLKGGQTDDA